MSLKARLLAIRDALRPSRPEPATSGPAGVIPIADPAVGQAILDMLKARGIVPAGATVRVSHHQIGAPAGVPPPADPVADSMTWEDWRGHMGHLTGLHGWSPCRFANRRGDNDAGFVFGVVKGDFGIWNAPFMVCDEDEEFDQTEQVLTCLTYLPSGFGMGLFADRPTAAEAADLATAMSGWEGLPYDDGVTPAAVTAWRAHLKRMQSTWEFHGIDHNKNRHAHQGHHALTPSMGIWTKTAANLIAGKPERVS